MTAHQPAFHPPLPLTRPHIPTASLSPLPQPSPTLSPSLPPSASLSRRAFLALPLLLPLALPLPSLADRTGKYSTKLTAKRRYLPRIAAGFAALRALDVASPTAVRAFVDGPAADLRFAMPLFSTTFFSEGNRIGEKERVLKSVEGRFFQAVDGLGKAGSGDEVREAWERAKKEAEAYVGEAGIGDAVDRK